MKWNGDSGCFDISEFFFLETFEASYVSLVTSAIDGEKYSF